MNLLRELPIQYLENCPIVDDRYKILFRLGTGRFSKVRMAICLKSGQRVAVKIMNDIHQKQTQDSDVIKYDTKVVKSFLNQIRMCVKSKHKHVIQITDFNIGGTYRTADGQVRRIFYYVMKIANNGQLFRIIKQTELLNQRIARLIFHQLITGIQKLHSDRISHCDIKAENILIDNKFNVKIADFGCSKYFMDIEHNKIQMDPSQPVGTVKSIAPEVKNFQINGFYHGDQIDLFACGCLLFQLVMKIQPFKSSDLKDQNYSRLMNKETQDFWKLFSKHCNPSVEFKDLIQRLLDPNPKTRINLLQLKKHEWFVGDLPNKNQYKKEMTVRLKKVGAKIRKQQEQQIKLFFKQQRSKIQLKMLPKVYINRQIEEEINGLRNYMKHNDNSDSSSGMSNADARQRQQELKKSKVCSQCQ